MAVLGSLGDLVLSLSADTARFQSDLGRGQRMADKFGRDVGRVLGNLAGMFVALAGAGGFGALIKGQIDAADATGKMSQKIGISTEALSSYMVAAKLADVSNEQLQVGLQQLAKNQADFVTGIGEAKDAFSALGITQQQVKDLNGDTAKLFELVAGKLSKFEDGANKTAIAMKIFGRSGAELIPMINSLEGARHEAEELGAVIDKDTAAAAERFNDNLTRVGVSTQALGLGIARSLLPTLEMLSEKMVEFSKDTESVQKAATVASTGLKLLVSAGTVVVTIFEIAGETIGGFVAMAQQLLTGNFRQALNTSGNIMIDWQKRVNEAVRSIDDTWDTTAGSIKGKSPETAKKIAAPAIEAAETTAKAAKDMAAAIMVVYDNAMNAVKADEEIEKQASEHAQQQAEQLAMKYQLAADRQAEFTDPSKLQAQVDALANVKDMAHDLGLTFSSAFEKAVANGEDLRDVIKGLGQDILKLFIRKTFTEPMTDYFGGVFKNIFGGGGAAASGSVAPTGTADLGWAGTFAEGTDYVPRTGLALVHQGEKITPAGQNSGGIHQTINFSANTPAAVRAAVLEMAPQLAAYAQAGIEDSLNRGSRRFAPR